jgi:hypothetical protein
MSFGSVIEASCGKRAALASQVAVIVNNMGELVVRASAGTVYVAAKGHGQSQARAGAAPLTLRAQVFLIIIGDVLVGPVHDVEEKGVLEPLGQATQGRDEAPALCSLCCRREPFNKKAFAIGLAVLCMHLPLCLLRRVREPPPRLAAAQCARAYADELSR